MTKIERFEDLLCWQKSRELVHKVYSITAKGELSKDYDLKSQLRRASVSTMNNIAEGFSRFSKKDFIKFLDYTSASAGEIRSMSYILEDLNYEREEVLKELRLLIKETHNLTLGLIRYLAKDGK